MQSNAHLAEVSQVCFIGVPSGRECGYCGSETGSHAFYLKAVTLTAPHYQKLLDRGWRRSGHLLYRPNLKRSCCIQYTVRLDATKFKPSKEHRKTLNKWERYVLGDEYIKEIAIRYPKTKEEKKKAKTEFDLFRSIHAPECPKLRIPPQPKHRLEVTIEPSVFTEEKFELFRHYQQEVHKEEPGKTTEMGFRRFLCNSPLYATEPYPSDGRKRLGSFHQMYRLDGKLIAMSVLDFLPSCVSGVYFMYHRDYEAYGLGKLSACREAAMAAEEGYTYYYMGFYIHTCRKMRYKARFQPTYLLDPETNEWNLLDEEMRKEMDTRFYVSTARPQEEWEYGEYVKSKETREEEKEEMGEVVGGMQEKERRFEDEDKGEQEGEVEQKEKEENMEAAEEEEEEEDGYKDLWTSGMPGIPSIAEIEDLMDLSQIKIFLKDVGHFTAARIHQFYNFGGPVRVAIREFAASVGPELAKEIELRFDRP